MVWMEWCLVGQAEAALKIVISENRVEMLRDTASQFKNFLIKKLIIKIRPFYLYIFCIPLFNEFIVSGKMNILSVDMT